MLTLNDVDSHGILTLDSTDPFNADPLIDLASLSTDSDVDQLWYGFQKIRELAAQVCGRGGYYQQLPPRLVLQHSPTLFSFPNLTLTLGAICFFV